MLPNLDVVGSLQAFEENLTAARIGSVKEKDAGV
jgi:hypothetical protein